MPPQLYSSIFVILGLLGTAATADSGDPTSSSAALSFLVKQSVMYDYSRDCRIRHRFFATLLLSSAGTQCCLRKYVAGSLLHAGDQAISRGEFTAAVGHYTTFISEQTSVDLESTTLKLKI